MFGMTMAFAAAGITQTYLERILGIGYLETQRKIQVHFLMLVGTGTLFVAGCRAVPLRLLLRRATPAGGMRSRAPAARRRRLSRRP